MKYNHRITLKLWHSGLVIQFMFVELIVVIVHIYNTKYICIPPIKEQNCKTKIYIYMHVHKIVNKIREK